MSPLAVLVLQFGLVGCVVIFSLSGPKPTKRRIALIRHVLLCLATGPILWGVLALSGVVAVRAETFVGILGLLTCLGLGLGFATGTLLFQRPIRAFIVRSLTHMPSQTAPNVASPKPSTEKPSLPEPDQRQLLVWCEECQQWIPAANVHIHSTLAS